MKPSKNDPNFEEFVKAREMMKGERPAAFAIFERLAENESLESMVIIADGLSDGYYYERDPEKAERWYRKAIGLGFVPAYYRLGRLFLNEGKFDEAKILLEHAVSEEYAPAMTSLGYMYFCGKGVKKDHLKARSLWRQGASLGHLYCKRSLAITYFRGDFGNYRRLSGVFIWLSMIIGAILVASKDPYSDLLS